MKSMKKSMAITTILMVVLLVVALSTATFAWYTAQSSANVAKTTVTSASSNSASLVIDTMKGNASSTNSSVTIEMSSQTTAIPPMMYGMGSWATTETTLNEFTAKFVTFTVNNAGQYATTPVVANPAVISKVTGSAEEQTTNDIYVTNIGGQAANVKATVTIDPYTKVNGLTVGVSKVKGLYTYDAGSKEYTLISDASATAAEGTDYYRSNANLKVAMFIDTAAADTDAYKYFEVWGMTNSVKYAAYYNEGTLVSKNAGDTLITNSTYDHGKASGAQSGDISLTSGAAVKVTFVAWFEGEGMTNLLAGTSADFSVSFAAEAGTGA